MTQDQLAVDPIEADCTVEPTDQAVDEAPVKPVVQTADAVAVIVPERRLPSASPAVSRDVNLRSPHGRELPWRDSPRARAIVGQVLTLTYEQHRPGPMLDLLNAWCRSQGFPVIAERTLRAYVARAKVLTREAELKTMNEMVGVHLDLMAKGHALVKDPNQPPMVVAAALKEIRENAVAVERLTGMIDSKGMGVAIQVNVQTNQRVTYQPGTEEAAAKATAILELLNPDD